MPVFEALVRRTLAAHERADAAHKDTRAKIALVVSKGKH
jgi:hypothetical protein